MNERRLVETGHGPAYVDMLICDRCGSEAAEDTATGWATVRPAGVNIQTMGEYPELVVCSWPCLRQIDKRFPLNTEPQE